MAPASPCSGGQHAEGRHPPPTKSLARPSTSPGVITPLSHLIGRVVPGSYTHLKHRPGSGLKLLPKSMARTVHASRDGRALASTVVDGPQMDPSPSKQPTTTNFGQSTKPQVRPYFVGYRVVREVAFSVSRLQTDSPSTTPSPRGLKWPLTCGFVLSPGYRWCPNRTAVVLRS